MLVNEELTENGEVVLLLMLPLAGPAGPKPLCEAEVAKLEAALKKEGVALSSLYEYDVLQKCALSASLDEDRIRSLLSLSFELNYEIQNLNEQGIWVVTVYDADYPKTLKKRMRGKAPHYLFGTGKTGNLERGGFAMLSTGAANRSAVQFASETAEKLVSEHILLLSTGARGIETSVVGTVLEKGGSALMVVPDSLLSRSYSDCYSEAVRDGRLTMLSTSHPRASFAPTRQTAAAEALLSLADYTLVVASDLRRGSIWAASTAFLKKRSHSPLFTYKSDPEGLGNKALESLGAITWPQINDMKALIPQLERAVDPSSEEEAEYTQGELF